MQGAGSAIERTAFVAIVGHCYAEEKGKYLVVQLVAMMAGKASGPFISGVLYTALGYDWLFYIIALSNFGKAFLYSCFPADLANSNLSSASWRDTKSSSFKFCTRAPALFAFLSAYVLPATHVHLDPTLANKLRHDFHILE